MIFFLIIVYFSMSAVFWRDEEGLLAVRNNLNDYQVRKEIIVNQTEDRSIIIVQRGDKVIWPDRRVIILNDFLAKPEVWPALISQAPLYGYLDFSEQDWADFQAILGGYNFSVKKINDFENNEDLYRLTAE